MDTLLFLLFGMGLKFALGGLILVIVGYSLFLFVWAPKQNAKVLAAVELEKRKDEHRRTKDRPIDAPQPLLIVWEECSWDKNSMFWDFPEQFRINNPDELSRALNSSGDEVIVQVFNASPPEGSLIVIIREGSQADWAEFLKNSKEVLKEHFGRHIEFIDRNAVFLAQNQTV